MILVTGGAGFIGSHVVAMLREQGEDVRVLDSLEPQVHGDGRPDLDVEFIRGDAGDRVALRDALTDVDKVLHLAAAVGVGQSMYEPDRYVERNTLATASLLSHAVQAGVERIVTASSMSIYGEGLYTDEHGHPVEVRRTDPRPGQWDPEGPEGPLRPVPTPETKTPDLTSVYALTKYDQERLTLMMGRAYGTPTLALRFFNTYGPGQALQNPYTGVMAIFAARLLNGQAPMVYEDGKQLRDFIHVKDVARACCMALSSKTSGEALNIGTGTAHSVLDVAHQLAGALDLDVAPQVTQKARAGDIRHCYAGVARARDVLGFQARIGFEEGLRDLVDWLADQHPEDRVPAATAELEQRGLVR